MEFLYETHMHTSEVSGCATSTAAEQVYRYKQLGYSGVIITDHFVNGYSTCPVDAPWDVKMKRYVRGYEKAKAAGDECGLDVFLGWEYTIRGSDFLTYGLDLEFLLAHPGLDKLSIKDYSALVRENGGYIAQAHPYRQAWYIERSLPVDHKLLDGVEVFNSCDTTKSNRSALEFAEKHGLPMQAGSDSHSVEHHTYSGIALDKKADGIFDIINAIKDNMVRLL